MSYLLTDPATVFLAGGSDSERDRVRSILADGGSRTVVTADSIDAVLGLLDERDDVGCLVVVDSPTAANGASELDSGGESVASSGFVSEWCESVREQEDTVPVVLLSDDTGIATELAARSGCRYLPRSATDSAVRAAVDDALETYRERRRRAAESSLFRTLLQESDVPIFAKDEDGRHLYKSELVHDDVTPEEVVGKTDLELVDEEDESFAEEAYEDDMAVIESGEGIHEMEERTGSGNEEYWGLTTKVPWRDEDGAVQGLVGLSFDITWWKQRERQLAAERQRIDRFTKYLAHDLRTPLQIAYGALEPARNGDSEAFDKLEAANEQMRDIVDDLSGLSSGTGGQERGVTRAYDAVRVGVASTHLVPLIEEVWDDVGTDDGTLQVHMPADTIVVSRTETMRPIIESLLKNAVEYAGPDAAVTVGTTGDRGFYVADDGPGLPDEIREQFSEGEPLQSFEGIGTGLLVVAETVHQQGWTLALPDQRGDGARIEIRDCPVITDTLVSAAGSTPVDLDDNDDIGPVSREGAASYDPESDSWRVVANGENVWGDVHEFHFVYGLAQAPVRLQGRITAIDGVDEYTKAGFTVRAGLEEDAPFGYVGTTRDHGSETTWRTARDGHTDSDQFEERTDAFGWYRIEYGDGEVTCYLSSDGEEWRPIDQRNLDLGDAVYVGLSVCSHDEDETCEATFSDVQASRLDVG